MMASVQFRRTLALIFIGVFTLLNAADDKPVFLYSRYFNAQGENRYAPETTYKNILAHLATSFSLRVHDKPLRADTLADVDVVLIANPSDKAFKDFPAPPHCTPEDSAAIMSYIRSGGGLIIMTNQEKHNLETTAMNSLLAECGMQFDNSNYTDAKRIVIPSQTPIIGGLALAYYTGNQIVLNAEHAAKPQVVVRNDPTQKALGGERNSDSILMAISTPEKGRVVAVTDSGWIMNSALDGKGIGKVAIAEHDNALIFTKLAQWSAEGKPKKAAIK
jgi:hypothetical protein